MVSSDGVCEGRLRGGVALATLSAVLRRPSYSIRRFSPGPFFDASCAHHVEGRSCAEIVDPVSKSALGDATAEHAGAAALRARFFFPENAVCARVRRCREARFIFWMVQKGLLLPGTSNMDAAGTL